MVHSRGAPEIAVLRIASTDKGRLYFVHNSGEKPMSRRPVRGFFLPLVLSLGLATLAQPAISAAQVTGSATISLSIQNHPSNGSDGYTDTTASNGKVYSYKYSGGSGKGG